MVLIADKPKTRSDERHEVHVTVSHESVYSLRQDEVTNISGGGLFLRTDRPLPVGTVLYMSIDAGLSDGPISVVGKVAWLRPTGESEPAGIGVSFLPLEPGEQRRLAEYLAKVEN